MPGNVIEVSRELVELQIATTYFELDQFLKAIQEQLYQKTPTHI